MRVLLTNDDGIQAAGLQTLAYDARGHGESEKLYDRALRYHAHTLGIATPDLAAGLFPFCERTILLADRKPEEASQDQPDEPRARRLVLHAPDVWERLLAAVATKN